MKRRISALLVACLALTACASWGGFQFDNDDVCETIVNARDRLDCFEQARREKAERQQDKADKDEK